MTGATIKSVFVKTALSEIEDDDNLGYELQKVRDDYEHAIIIQETDMRNARGRRYTLVSSGRVFPEDVQATIKPYLDRADFDHHLNPGTSDTVEEQEVRVMVETADGEDYHIQKLDEERYYVSRDNKPVKPPHAVNQKAEQVFPDYEPML